MMRVIRLEFHGYTWDEYFDTIENRSGILVVYKGGLDSEGFVRMYEILYVGYADKMSELYESKRISEIRNSLNANDRLFFSFAEVNHDVRNLAVAIIQKSLNLNLYKTDNTVRLLCKGACALFPKELLIVEQS